MEQLFLILSRRFNSRINKLHLKGNLVLCSHEHDDHNARDCVDVLPKEFKVEKIETYHDHHLGSRRGKNYDSYFNL